MKPVVPIELQVFQAFRLPLWIPYQVYEATVDAQYKVSRPLMHKATPKDNHILTASNLKGLL